MCKPIPGFSCLRETQPLRMYAYRSEVRKSCHLRAASAAAEPAAAVAVTAAATWQAKLGSAPPHQPGPSRRASSLSACPQAA